ncbi:hypothetical protein F4821DRAFT_234448 [Hypoxylon rubiginosum]|uniref:Uncharacterized protein n=1 Tax=Hypoxylon rubiginosum TaxID=110542 RepID=A0ACC0D5X3_9PEZI|nr:hypothetical protein F4821DRAFT_234448 [Hypoxylon rubiginosum]
MPRLSTRRKSGDFRKSGSRPSENWWCNQAQVVDALRSRVMQTYVGNERIDSALQCAPGEKFVRFPNVQAWHGRMTERPEWKRWRTGYSHTGKRH